MTISTPVDAAGASQISASVRDQLDAAADLEHVAKALDGQYMRAPQGKLPRSLADLRRLGVDETILDSLAALVAGEVTEEMVVRAFLEALEPAAKQAGVSRQLLRALRNQFKTADEWADSEPPWRPSWRRRSWPGAQRHDTADTARKRKSRGSFAMTAKT